MSSSSIQQTSGTTTQSSQQQQQHQQQQTQTSSTTPQQQPINRKQPSLKWTERMEDTLLIFLQKEVSEGKRVDNSFKQKTWEAGVDLIKSVMGRDSDKELVNAKKIKEKWEHMKKDYSIFRMLKNQSQLGWDETTHRTTCDDGVWNSYIKVHKSASKFRLRGLRNYERLANLLDGQAFTTSTTTGEFGSSSSTSSRTTTTTKRAAATVPSTIPLDEVEVEVEPESCSSTTTTATTSTSTKSSTSTAIRSSTSSPIYPSSITTTPARSSSSTSSSTPLVENTLNHPHHHHKRRRRADPLLDATKNLITALALRKQGVRSQAISKVEEEFPKLNSKKLVAIYDLFEDAIKAEMFVGMNNKKAMKEWLKRQLRLKGDIDIGSNSDLEDDESEVQDMEDTEEEEGGDDE